MPTIGLTAIQTTKDLRIIKQQQLSVLFCTCCFLRFVQQTLQFLWLMQMVTEPHLYDHYCTYLLDHFFAVLLCIATCIAMPYKQLTTWLTDEVRGLTRCSHVQKQRKPVVVVVVVFEISLHFCLSLFAIYMWCIHRDRTWLWLLPVPRTTRLGFCIPRGRPFYSRSRYLSMTV